MYRLIVVLYKKLVRCYSAAISALYLSVLYLYLSVLWDDTLTPPERRLPPQGQRGHYADDTAQPPAAHSRRHSRPHHHRQGEHKHSAATARQPIYRCFTSSSIYPTSIPSPRAHISPGPIALDQIYILAISIYQSMLSIYPK